MNQAWKSFLVQRQAHFNTETDIVFEGCKNTKTGYLHPVSYLAVLKVTGKDASQFLQGQVTCNVNEITANKCSFGAYCNPKGRVITTFLILKPHDDFLLILPEKLLETVADKLRKYILRADVKLIDGRDDYCLIGINLVSADASLGFPERDLEVATSAYNLLKLPSSRIRYLAVAEPEQAVKLWSSLTDVQSFQPGDSLLWQLFDIEDKIPWVDQETTEEFIPQMLNIDKLGGISLNKGCYTGQEIVARTHYLGKTKRELFLAEHDNEQPPTPNTAILDDNGQTIGKVLRAEKNKILAVLPVSESNSDNLTLDTTTKDKIKIISL